MTDTERDMLVFAGQRWQYAGNQEDAIRDRFGLSAIRYWQIVNRVLNDPDALAREPQLVRRLQRLRASRP